MHFFFFACYSFLPSVPPSCPHKELTEGLLTTTACSSSWTSILLAPLAFQVQTPSVSGTCRGRKLRGSRISDTFVCRKHAKPWHIFQPLPSEDESEKKGRRPGTHASSSSCRDQPVRKETSTAYLHWRKQAQPMVETHVQEPRRTPPVQTAALYQTCSVLMA